MPFLKAALIPHKEPEKPRKKPKMAIRSVQDMVIAKAVRVWLYLDDQMTKAELARMGLA